MPHCWAKLSLRFPSCTPQPSGSLSQSLFLTIWKIFFNVDMVDSVHLLLLQLQKSMVGPGSGASPVVLAKAPPLSWCWCKPSSGVSVSSPSQPVFPAGWCCGGTLQLLQRLSRPHNGLWWCVLHHRFAPGRFAQCASHSEMVSIGAPSVFSTMASCGFCLKGSAPKTQWCSALIIF